MRKILSATALAVMLSGAANASTVNFDGLTVGSVLTEFDFGAGLTGTASADGASAGSPDVAVVFQTTAANTADPDLQSPFSLAGALDDALDRSFGNAIIAQENAANGGVYTPDDDGTGGLIQFAFDSLINLGRVFLLDARVGSTVTLYDGATSVGALTTTIDADSNNNTDNNLYTFLDFDGLAGDRFVVDFNGRSGAIGEFEASIAAVPVPASLPLLLAGFAAFGFVSRRNKAA